MIKVSLGGRPVVDPAKIREFTRRGGGPVINEMMRRGQNVQTRARQLAPKRTRALERSITKNLSVEPRGVVVYVGTDLPYAVHVHQGTRAHVIVPVRRKTLRFPASGSTPGSVGVVFARRVNHPGNAPDPFLILALPAGRH